MAASCHVCRGTGIEKDVRDGVTVSSLCRSCGGSGGWNEVDTDHGSPLAKAMIEAAARRRAGLRD